VYDTIDGLVSGMRANPKDFAPRLVYADALDELGHAAAAAFVRRHCAVYRLPVWHPERRSATVQDDLAGAVAAGGVFPSGPVQTDESTLDLRIGTEPFDGLWVYRGLIDRFDGNLDDWVRQADALLRWHPVRSAWVKIWSDEFLVVTDGGPGHPRELTVAVPGAGPLGPVPVPAGHDGLVTAVAGLFAERWPQVRFRVHRRHVF
jgi:uncharacterized protein (TIGR02996 family)